MIETNTNKLSCFNEALDALISSKAKRIEVQAKKVFIFPGEKIENILYIHSGRTRHYMIGPEGNEKVAYILEPGNFLRESAFLTTFPNVDKKDPVYRISQRFSMAEVPCVLYSIDYPLYKELLNYSNFAEALLVSSCKKSQFLRLEIESMIFDSSKERIKNIFASSADRSELADNNWYNLRQKYTHHELASIIGVNRVTITKLINQLCNEEVARIVNRKIQINKKYVSY